MEIYNVYNTIISLFLGLRGERGYAELHENVKLLTSAVLSGVGVWLILHLLLSFGLYAMAKRSGLNKKYKAFIPFCNMVYAEKLAGSCTFFGQRIKHPGMFVAILQGVCFLSGAFAVFANVTLDMNYIIKQQGNYVVYTTVSGGTPTSSFARFLIGYLQVFSGLYSLVELVYLVFLFVLASALYKKYAPNASFWLSWLTVIAPSAFAIVVFVLRRRKPVDYAAYMRKRREAYYRAHGYGGYGNQNGSNQNQGGYGGMNGSYGSQNGNYDNGGYASAPNNGAEEPFGEFGGSGKGNDSPFSDIDG